MSDQDGTPSTADKFERLAKLESDFQRTLEVEKLEAMAEFAAGAGHEINNPLTVISGRAQLLLREETDPERKHALALISAQAMRVYEMIADMMLFARPPRPERQPVELIKLIDDLIADFLPRCARQQTSLCRMIGKGDRIALPERPEGCLAQSGPVPLSDPILIEADPAQLNVALRAMCQNSLETLGSGGRIEIAVEQVNNGGEKGDRIALPERPEGCAAKSEPVPLFATEVRIRISDDGPGIKPEERRHLFDPFYSARQAGRGLGLGLSKAWRIVTNHGGRIDVESEPGHGAVFIITLPKKP